MYANADSVRTLCRNIRSSIPDDEIEAVSALVDGEIDGEIGQLYYWPEDASGDPVAPVPALVRTISTYLVAALLCQGKYAQNESGGLEANPYAVSLDRRGRAILNRILDGKQHVPGLQRVGALASRAAQPVFSPVRGFGRSGEVI